MKRLISIAYVLLLLTGCISIHVDKSVDITTNGGSVNSSVENVSSTTSDADVDGEVQVPLIP